MKRPKNTGPKKAIKIRIYPDKEQTILLYKTFGCCRKLFNTFLDLKRNRQPCPTEHELKEQFSFMKEVDSIALQQSRVNLVNAFDNFFKSIKGQRKGPKMGQPKFKSKRNGHQSYKTNNVNNSIRINFETRHIKLPILGWVKFRDNRVFNAQIRSATVSKDPSNRFYVSILIDKVVPRVKVAPKKALKKVIGMDMSMKNVLVNSKGTKLEHPKYFRKYEEKLAWEQRKLSRKQKGSKTQKSSHKYQKQRIKVAKIQAKISDSRNDFMQKLSTQITNEYDLICIESLNMHAMAQSLNLGKSVNDLGWGMFIRMLEYKSLWKGKYIIEIPKYFPSSQLCHACAYRYKGLTLSERTWVCPVCGTVHDRDINAAINVEVEGVRIFKERYGTVGTTETGSCRKARPINARGDCVRPMHAQDLACEALSCTGNGR